jgi:hypothetical protein
MPPGDSGAPFAAEAGDPVPGTGCGAFRAALAALRWSSVSSALACADCLLSCCDSAESDCRGAPWALPKLPKPPFGRAGAALAALALPAAGDEAPACRLLNEPKPDFGGAERDGAADEGLLDAWLLDGCDEKPWLNEPPGLAPASGAGASESSTDSAMAKWAVFNMVKGAVKS